LWFQLLSFGFYEPRKFESRRTEWIEVDLGSVGLNVGQDFVRRVFVRLAFIKSWSRFCEKGFGSFGIY
jgi:hypothetical protein